MSQPTFAPLLHGVLTGTETVIKLGVNNGAEPLVSPAASVPSGVAARRRSLAGLVRGGWPRGGG